MKISDTKQVINVQTSGVIELINKAVANEKYLNDFTGVLWDIYTIFKYAAKSAKGNTVYFKVIILGVGRKRYVDFIAEVGACSTTF